MVSCKALRNQRRLIVFVAALALALNSFFVCAAAQQAQRSPSDTVREFYQAMREKRFREAFGMSIYKPAVYGLKPAEFEDLRSDFNNMAAAIPEKVEISGVLPISRPSISLLTRLRISSAALFVNVTARMLRGQTPRSAIR